MYNSPIAELRGKGLERVVSSCLTDVSAMCSNSYGGIFIQELRNLCINPSVSKDTDPESSGGFFMGITLATAVSDPSFNGKVGRKGSYIGFNGSQFLTYKGYDTLFRPKGVCNNWHKTSGGNDHTVVIRFRYKANAVNEQTLYTTKASAASSLGVALTITTTGKLKLTQRGGTATTTATSTTSLVDGYDFIIRCSHSHANNRTRLSIIGIDLPIITTEELSHTYNASSSSASAPLFVGVMYNLLISIPTLFLAAGTRLYDLSIYNAEITEAQFDSIVEHITTYRPLS